jgi:hypothetical protein
VKSDAQMFEPQYRQTILAFTEPIWLAQCIISYIRTNRRVSLVYFRKNLESSADSNEWSSQFYGRWQPWVIKSLGREYLEGKVNYVLSLFFDIDLHYNCVLFSPEITGVVLAQYNICRSQQNSWVFNLIVALSNCKRNRRFGEHVGKQRCNLKNVTVLLVSMIAEQE